MLPVIATPVAGGVLLAQGDPGAAYWVAGAGLGVSLFGAIAGGVIGRGRDVGW